MADILHDISIEASPQQVFDAISTPRGLESWWTKKCDGHPAPEAEYRLWFGPEHDWRASVSKCVPGSEFELHLTSADQDWTGTRVRFRLDPEPRGTGIRFHHLGWGAANDHFRLSSYCWATYLRLLKRYLEHGEVVPYEERDD